ncbi:Alpha/beta hydrolase [Burkholderia sp. 8Y]|uniref:alpha/beta fold hydrolase n=1 Tax=Burkholderia sp. 8Y TaxID=2653133 RepID=UPI0012EFC66E|nr:alpha/beta hydrolase [Burkholderia sp. 8Y]VXB39484.1 Alpha/beta hydrolase [Burkholderia sp. 8Y]
MRQPSKSAVSPGKLLAGSVAAASLGVAAWAALRARRAERDHPPVGRFIDVDGVRLHYIDEGEGPVIVLLHGNLVMLEDYVASGLFDRLTKRHRVIAFDRPGFGYSARPRDRAWTPQAQAALFQQALKRMGLTRAVIVGQSLGCLTALFMALDPRMDIGGLTLVSGYYYPSARFDVLLTAPAAIPVVGDVMRYTISPIAARLMINQNLRLMFAPQNVPEVFREMLPREMLLRPSQMRAISEDAAFMVPAAHELSNRYGEVSVPVRIFAGKDDAIVDADSHSGRLHRDIAQSTITVVPDRGHMLHYDEASRIADAIEAMALE